jgi:hypothetical protein
MNLPYLLDNPDLIQPLLDCAYANLGWNSDIVFEMVTCVWEAMRLEAELRTLPAPTEEERNKYTTIAAVVEVLATTGVVLLGCSCYSFRPSACSCSSGPGAACTCSSRPYRPLGHLRLDERQRRAGVQELRQVLHSDAGFSSSPPIGLAVVGFGKGTHDLEKLTVSFVQWAL